MWPLVFLIAVTVAGVGVRAVLKSSPTPATKPPVVHTTPTARFYKVRPGDTLTGVAAKSGISLTRLLRLNPKLQPTALFIGERIRLR